MGDSLVLSEKSLDWALEHALNYGDTDVFPLPFEYHAIKHDWKNVKEYIRGQGILNWTIRQPRSVLAPKARFGFRVITQLDPLDFIVFTTLVKELGPDIEGARVPTSEKRVFSYRYRPGANGRFFDPLVGYTKFQKICETLIKKKTVKYVVVTDIADFYNRIYHHRLENALDSCTKRSDHAKAVRRLLSGWNNSETFGIPVGSAPARLLAELTIADVDEALLARRIEFVRFNDDFRIFAKTYQEAYKSLSLLAEILFQNHGLTLQQQKTDIITSGEFRAGFLHTPSSQAISSLSDKFYSLLSDIGIDDPYGEIDIDSLSPESKAAIDSLNLSSIIVDQVESEGEPDLPLLRFCLRRLAQIGHAALIDYLLDNVDTLHPVWPDIISYIRNSKGLRRGERERIGRKLLALEKNGVTSQLEYHRMWTFDLFAESDRWGCAKDLFAYLANASDLKARRKLILAAGRADQRHWFQSRWRSLIDESPWPRRALLAAASCLAADARTHLYKSLEPQLDVLEKAVVRWVKAKPFGK